MNIYDMLDWIRKHDNSIGHKYIFTADFLNDRNLRDVLKSEDLFYCLLELMKEIIEAAAYE